MQLSRLGLSMFLASLGVSTANIALPAIGRDFVVPFGQVKWGVVVYLGGLTVATVGAGRLGDRFGRYRVLRARLVGFMVVSLGGALAPWLWALVAGRLVQGLAAAVLMTLSMALVKEAAGPGKQGRAMGALASMGALGTSLGGVLVADLGWRGTVSGILALSRNLGLMAGAWGMGAVFAAAVGASMDVAAATDIVRGMCLTFSLCAALMIAGLLVIQFGKVGRA